GVGWAGQEGSCIHGRPRAWAQSRLSIGGDLGAALWVRELRLPCSACQAMADTDRTLARRFIVRGRVQGVGFRWFVEREAHMLGLGGWVRNNPDGSVEVLAMGTPDQLSGLRSRLH